MPTDPGSYAGQRVTVMGLGRFGGGVGAARFLVERGAHVLVTDTAPPQDLADSIAKLADLEPGHASGGTLTYRLGGHDEADFTSRDLLVVNPAVKPGNPYVAAARAAGVPVTSEIRLLVRHLPNRRKTIGITGTAGKSTTTAMTAHILRRVLGQPGETPYDGHTQRQIGGPGVWMGGNLGGSLLPTVELIRDDDWVVLELSSFMLEGLREDRWSPHIAVITNISPNHLDWHGTMENYVAAKQAILDHQEVGVDFALLHSASDQWLEPRTDCERYGNRKDGNAPPCRSRLVGVHNRSNEECAIRACFNAFFYGDQRGRLPIDFEAALADFRGLPHRLEFIGNLGGSNFYNDSKSTTPEATRLAVEAFGERATRLIVGGYDKGADFGELATFIAGRCRSVYTIGTTGDAIANRVETAGGRAERCGTLDLAVERVLNESVAGEAVLLSPGCASWDQFANYEERGERFVELVQQHAAAQQKKPTD